MEVRYNQETEGMVLKNGLKEGKDGKDSQGSLTKSFLKDQQDSFAPSGTVDTCDKNRGSTGDPDYCRRILVRGNVRPLISKLVSVCRTQMHLTNLKNEIILKKSCKTSSVMSQCGRLVH